MVLNYKKTLSFIFLIVAIFVFAAFDVHAEDEYVVYDALNGEVIETFERYNSALSFYNNNLDDYENLVLAQGDTVLFMEYGIVEFQTNDECSLNVGYRSLRRNDTTSINGCYGKDGLYLDRNGDNVKFAYVGDVGITSFDSVILRPFDSLNVRVSLYRNLEGDLAHLIKTQLYSDYYAKVYKLDKAPDFLEENKDYYSYDGHYFYEDFKVMTDDYRNDTRINAVNSELPFYSYFQYLSFRSLSNYSAKELDDFFKNELKIVGRMDKYNDDINDGANNIINRSEYYDNLDSFFIYQNIFGTNAMNSLAISMRESSSAKNLKAYVNHDLFTNNAYDNDEERNDNAYKNIDKSIYSFDKYILSNHNGNYHSSLYGGTFLGDKLSGYTLFNTLDAYYGENISSNYYLFDKALGGKDLDSYCLGIIYDLNRLTFYKDEELSKRMYRLYDLHNYSLIILGENEKSYKVQIDGSLSADYKYDFEKNVAFVDKEVFDLLINEDKMHENKLEQIAYDFGDGLFNNESSLSFNNLEGVELPLIKPVKDGLEFVGFDHDNIAQYKEIKGISVYAFPNNELDVNSYLNLEDAKIRINYVNGSNSIKDITSDMISGFDNTEVGEQEITITYCGESVSQKINVVENSNKTIIADLVNKNINSYKEDGTYDIDELEKLKGYLKDTKYYFGFDDLRLLDEMLFNEYSDYLNFVVFQSDLDVSISGLCVNVDTNLAKRTLFDGLIKNTYYVHIRDISRSSYNKLEEIGEAYGFESVCAFKSTFSLNLIRIDQEGEMIYSIKPKDMDPSSIYSVYCLEENGDIVKCKTYWSKDSVTFIGQGQGSYLLLRKKSVNTYTFDSIDESVNHENNDPDTQQFILLFVAYLIVEVFGVINILYHYIIEDKLRKSALEYKKLLNLKRSS